MILGTLERKLKTLNSRIRVYSTASIPISGVYIASPNLCELEHIGGVDRDNPQEHVSYNTDGSIRRGGWRRILKVLVERGLVDRYKAERLFQTHLEYKRSHKPRAKDKALGTLGGHK